jgi:putative polyketide hydroxylase
VTSYAVGPGADLVAEEGAFEQVTGVASDGAVLVRPDGVVSWRSDRADDPYAALEAALRQAVCRT